MTLLRDTEKEQWIKTSSSEDFDVAPGFREKDQYSVYAEWSPYGQDL
jgi:hypothetical protein